MRIFGETFQRLAVVVTIGGFAAHAGQKLLVEYALGVKETVKDIYLVHGEEQPAGVLTQKLAEAGMERVSYREPGFSVEI